MSFNIIRVHKHIEKYILSFLPPQDLYRLRVVCKRWNVILNKLCDTKYNFLSNVGQFISTASEFEQKMFVHAITTTSCIRHITNINLHDMFRHSFNISSSRVRQQLSNLSTKWIKDNWLPVIPKDKYICHIRTYYDYLDRYGAYIEIYREKCYGCFLRAKALNEFYYNFSNQIVPIERKDFIDGGCNEEEREDRRVICELCDKFFSESEILKVLEYECNYPN